MNQTPVSLVLSSGGARGYAHIGVIEALESSGYRIGSIVGCSMGAVIGGIYATGKLDQFKQWACGLQRRDIFKLYDFIFSNQGLIKGEKIFKQIETYISDCRIEDLSIPFLAIATDLRKEQEVVFNSGSLYKALRATSAVPAIVKPVEVDGMELIDGGVLNPLPMRHAVRTPGDILVVVDANTPVKPGGHRVAEMEPVEDKRYRNRLEKIVKKWFKKDANALRSGASKKLGFFELLIKSIELMQDQLVRETLKEYTPDILVQISRGTCGTFEYYKANEMIEEGKRSLQLAMEKYDQQKVG